MTYGAGKMVLQLRAHALAVDLSSVPSTRGVGRWGSELPVSLTPGDLMPLSSAGTCIQVQMLVQRQIHIHIIKQTNKQGCDRAEEMEHWSSIHIPFEENLSFLLSFYIKGLTPACNSSSRRLNISLASYTSITTRVHTCTQTLKSLKI